MQKTLEEKNKAMALEAFDTLFNRRDYAAAARFWSPDYIQHSAHIEPGRDGLFNLVKRFPPTLKYEPGAIVADGEFVIVHGRFSGFQAVNWIAADILHIENGLLVEHWDVIQDEASRKSQKVVCPCSAPNFPDGFRGLAEGSNRQRRKAPMSNYTQETARRLGSRKTGALAAVYCGSSHPNNAETRKLHPASNVACG